MTSKNTKKESMSFNKLIAYFAGGFVIFIILAIIAIKMIAVKRVETVVHRVNAENNSQQAEKLSLFEEREAAKRKAAAAEMSRARNAAVTDVATQLTVLSGKITTQNQLISAQTQQINNLTNRVSVIENARQNRSIEIIKPDPVKKETQATPSVEATKKQQMLGASAGYKTLAIVSSRAWIKAGEGEDSVVAGDPLPPIKRQPYVKSIDADTGIFISSPLTR